LKSSEIKIFGTILAIAIIMVGAVVYTTVMGDREKLAKTKQPVRPPDQLQITKEFLEKAGGHGKGDPNKEFWLVELGDLQCPSCMAADKMLRAKLPSLQDKLYYRFYHYRVAETHTNSPALAAASIAAGAQGKFWEMHDHLFDTQTSYSGAKSEAVLKMLTDAARDLKLDLLQFQPALTSKETMDAVDAEHELGLKMKADTTPSFYLYKFVNGKGVLVAGMGGAEGLTEWLRNPKELK